MPKRNTQTYSSEDAPESDDAKITVYYCKYSGEHVLITDAVLGQLPKRKTDNARVLDTDKYTVRLKAEPEVKAKLIKREGGKLALVAACADGGVGHACVLERYPQ